jgi:hypothetical protein
MTTKHKHHHSKKSDRHHDKPKVDLGERVVRLDSETYEWEADVYGDPEKWYRISKNSVLRNGKKIPFVAAKHRDERDSDGDEIDWQDVRHRVRDHHLVRKLNRAVDRAQRREDKAADSEKAKIAKLEDVLAMEEAVHSLTATSGSAEESATPRPKQSGTGSVTRTKRGVRVSSNDHKFYFNIAVFKSTKYPGCASVQLVVAGKWYNYTLDAANMKALREEVARGGN